MEPLGELHSAGSPGQKARKKVNWSQLKKQISPPTLLCHFSESQPVKLGGSSGRRRVISGLHACRYPSMPETSVISGNEHHSGKALLSLQ